jgi:Transposase DDE domain group 1
MPTECRPKRFEFEAVARRAVVACFDGGDITSNAGALLLGQVDRGLGLMRRFAACFTDRRDPRFVEHRVETLVGQRIFGLALGYEDLLDHDELRKDLTLAVLAGKLKPVLRSDCEALAGKSTLNRLEHTPKRHGQPVDEETYECTLLAPIALSAACNAAEQPQGPELSLVLVSCVPCPAECSIVPTTSNRSRHDRTHP